jgi:hypothetical protein
MNEEHDYMERSIEEILANANALRERLGLADNLSQVTIAKAAETDRLADENRRLRARVEELEASALAKLADAAHAAKNTPAPDYITRGQLVEAIGVAAQSADAGVRHALRLILDELVYP